MGPAAMDQRYFRKGPFLAVIPSMYFLARRKHGVCWIELYMSVRQWDISALLMVRANDGG